MSEKTIQAIGRCDPEEPLGPGDPRWHDYNHAMGSWHEGMALPGAAQMTVLRDFFTALPWTALTPRFGDPAWAEWDDPERCALATDGNRLYVAYCHGDTSAGTLKGLDPQASHAAQWFDPPEREVIEKFIEGAGPLVGRVQ